VLLALLVGVPLVALAQTAQQDEKSLFLKFVQDRLSTPDRQISISNIDGALSSNASIREIDVSDQQGVYLTLKNIVLDWNQAAIFLGRLEVNSLTADEVDYVRNPVAAASATPALPAPEAGGIAVPQLPVAVIVKKLAVPKISFGEAVFGLGSVISLNGNITLDGGSLDAGLGIKRLDGPGGALDLAVKYAKDSTNLDLNLGFEEPHGGIVATLLNIEGQPDISLTVKGSGPVSNLTTQLVLAADGKEVLGGKAEVKRQPSGFGIAAQLGGPIATILPAAYRDFFGTDTNLSASALLRDGGGLDIDSFALNGGQLKLTGAAATSPDWFLDKLALNGDIARADGQPVLLPVPGENTRLANGHLEVQFGGGSQNWQARLTGSGFSNGAIASRSLDITGSGVGANLDDAANRRLTFNVDGNVAGVTATDPAVADALGDSIGLGAAGLWSAGQPLQLAQFRLLGKAVSIGTAGTIDKGVFTGDVALSASDLAVFASLSGRPLAGSLNLKANGTISPLIGGFNLDLDGTGSNLAIGDVAADNLLKGTVRLTGGVARTADGVTARNFVIGNEQARFTANGAFKSDAADFSVGVALADLGLISPHAKGALNVSGTAQGSGGKIAFHLAANVPSGALLNRPLTAAAFGFDGSLQGGTLAGALNGQAQLGGQPVALNANLSTAGGRDALRGLSFSAGGTTLTGDVSRDDKGLMQGRLRLDASDISTAAAIALVEASGAANADITLTPQNGTQAVTVTAAARQVKLGDIRIASADLKAGIADLFGVPMVNGNASATDVVAGGVTLKTLAAEAKWDGQATNFESTAALASGTNLAAAGALAPIKGGYRLGIESLSLTQGSLRAALASPAALTISGDSVALDAVRLNVGDGSLTATGNAGKALDIAVTLAALPLGAANAVAPGLGLAGTLDGTIHLTGSSAAPHADFDVKGRGLEAKALAGFGVTPLTLAAKGNLDGRVVQLAQLTTSSPAGLSVTARGSVPLGLSGLAIDASGAVPLALANRLVAARGGQALGTAKFSAHIAGSAATPKLTGQASIDGASYVDPATSLKLTGMSMRATLAGNTATLDRFSAQVATGGTISAEGTVSLAPSYTGNVGLKLVHVRYVNQPLLITTVSGDLSVKGKLAESPVIGGTIDIERADIAVPSQLGGGATAIKVKHVDPPKPVADSLARVAGDIGKAAATSASANAGAGPRLDLTVRAPNQIFIRGRGLDAEVGGTLRLTGSLDDVHPVGAFDLIRGRLDILGQRMNFDSGSVTLTGDLDPEIALAATVPSDDITAKITVSGHASDPQIEFSSTPTLAQDEILSRLLFKQGIEKLSALQLAKLASAAASLAGGSNSSLLDDLRASTGLDDLDLTTDASGQTAVKAGRYLDDNIYLGVQAGADGKSKVTVNLDLAPGLKANAGTGTDGDSGVGLLYEQDY